MTWVTADVTTWSTAPQTAGLHAGRLPAPAEPETTACSPVRSLVAPGGRLLVLGHDVENMTAGVGGPQEAAILHSVDRLAPVAALLEVDRLEQVRRLTRGRHRARHLALGTPTGPDAISGDSLPP